MEDTVAVTFTVRIPRTLFGPATESAAGFGQTLTEFICEFLQEQIEMDEMERTPEFQAELRASMQLPMTHTLTEDGPVPII